jgi:hypothetical protein
MKLIPLSIISADLTFLNHVAGVLVLVAVTPVQTWLFSRDHKKHGHGRPEARFLLSLIGFWLFPISLLWYAFTCDGNTSYWSPLVAGGVLGFAEAMIWLSMLNYVTGGISFLNPLDLDLIFIIDSYPIVAASAIAAFLIPSYILAAALTHLGILMIDNMTTKWAMATIGFVSFGLCALVYILYFFGARIRKRSKFAKSF